MNNNKHRRIVHRARHTFSSALLFATFSFALPAIADTSEQIKETSHSFLDAAATVAEDVYDSIKNYVSDNKDEWADNAKKASHTIGEASSDAIDAAVDYTEDHKEDWAEAATKAGKKVSQMASDTAEKLDN